MAGYQNGLNRYYNLWTVHCECIFESNKCPSPQYYKIAMGSMEWPLVMCTSASQNPYILSLILREMQLELYRKNAAEGILCKKSEDRVVLSHIMQMLPRLTHITGLTLQAVLRSESNTDM